MEGWGEKRPWQPLLRDTAGLLRWKYGKVGDGQQSSFLLWTTSVLYFKVTMWALES